MRTFTFFSLLLAILLLAGASQVSARALWDGPETKNASGVTDWTPPVYHHHLTTGQIGALYNNFGGFGTGFIGTPLCDGEMCPSFESPEDSDLEYLFGGAVWVGGIVGDDTLVTVGVDGWYSVNEFLPPVEGRTFSEYSDYSTWTVYTDTTVDPEYINFDPVDNRPHLPLHLRIANRAHTWTSTPENKAIIYDMVITNIGDQPIESGYVGFYFDADVYHTSNQSSGFIDDITGSLRDEGIAYILDNDGDPDGGAFGATSPTRGFAFRFLQASITPPDTAYNWWISNGNPDLDYGPQPVDEFGNLVCDFDGRSGTPTGDVNKYCLLSHPGWDFDQIFVGDSIEGWNYPYNAAQAVDFADGYDTRFLMSIGPFDLLPDSSLRFFYTTCTGANIHVDPDNIQNIATDPDLYLANLDFTDLINTSTAADIASATILDPSLPVTGLYIAYNDLDSTLIEWDPYVYPDVTGYNIYLYEIPPDSLPYPGVVPPWITPSQLDLHTTVGTTYRYAFDTLQDYGMYLATVTQETGSGEGQMCDPILVQPGGKPPAPHMATDWIVVSDGDPAVVRWEEPDGVDVDFYNVYKFADPAAAENLYYPFYDTGEASDTLPPRYSFLVDGTWYYYYALEPHATVDSGITMYTEFAAENETYVVTAVTTSGLESDFSGPATVIQGPPQSRDIVVLYCNDDIRDFVECPDMADVFSTVLTGYDYELYYLKDTMTTYGQLPDRWWEDILPFKLVISDVGFRDDFLSANPFANTVPGYEIYIASGGILANFGSVENVHAGSVESDQFGTNPVTGEFATRYLGIDSVFLMGALYYLDNSSPPFVDSLIGMTRAEGTGGSVPDVGYNTAFPHSATLAGLWPVTETAPAPATFRVNDSAEIIQVLRSDVPATSLAEGDAVGVMASSGPAPAFAFGYHLWYMEQTDARALVDYMMSFTGETVAAATAIDPDTIHTVYAHSYNPLSGTVWLGDLGNGYTVTDITTATLTINHSVTPTSVAVDPSHPEFTGEVVNMTFAMSDFIASYDLLWGDRLRPYIVSGTMTDGTTLSAAGGVYLIGHRPGDANCDMVTNVGDAVYLIQYIFGYGDPPEPYALGDASGDCRVDIGDVVYLVNYIFRSGGEPLKGCAE